jgi:hypothetical protein
MRLQQIFGWYWTDFRLPVTVVSIRMSSLFFELFWPSNKIYKWVTNVMVAYGCHILFLKNCNFFRLTVFFCFTFFTPMCHLSDCHVHSVYVCTLYNGVYKLNRCLNKPYTGFIRGILRGVRYAKSLRVLFLHRRSPSWTTLVLYSRVVFIFNEPTISLLTYLYPFHWWPPPSTSYPPPPSPLQTLLVYISSVGFFKLGYCHP